MKPDLGRVTIARSHLQQIALKRVPDGARERRVWRATRGTRPRRRTRRAPGLGNYYPRSCLGGSPRSGGGTRALAVPPAAVSVSAG